jgi:hypothetical protein
VYQHSDSNDSAASDSAPLERTLRLLDEARAQLARADGDERRRYTELAQRTAGLEECLREMEQVLARTERQAAQLANLYVATYQLHASLDAADVRAAVADIAVNLLGAECFSIWVSEESGGLVRAPESSSRGDAAGALTVYAGGDGLLDACVAARAPKFGADAGSDAAVAVPFVAQGELVGVLVVERILPQKEGFSAQDRELLDLLAAHAASALLAARAFHLARRKLDTYEGLLGFLRRPGT